MKRNLSVRRVNVGRLKPVVDPFRARGGRIPDPDELPPSCPDCGCPETQWFTDQRTTQAVLVCAACIDSTVHPDDAPEGDVPHRV